MLKLGIMQGRLVPPEAGRFQSFPRERWRDEFPLAATAGLDTIEWIYDAYGEDVNPLSTGSGRMELARLTKVHGVLVQSVCADWFMDYPLIGVAESVRAQRWQRLAWLMSVCAPLGITRIVVPFVDASAIRNADDIDAVAEGLNGLVPLIEQTGVEIHLETALAPPAFAALLARVDHDGVRVNYDSGNSASLGFQPAEEFAAYGKRVGSVHIKDRRLGGGTVPLGLGDTDFDSLFAALEENAYRGDFILQVARGEQGEELSWTVGNVLRVRKMIRPLESGSKRVGTDVP